VTPEQFRELLQPGYEPQGVEFKGPGSRDDSAFFAKIARAVMGMANRRDGGIVAIGVNETDSGLHADGLNAELLSTWGYDDVADALSKYIEPTVRFELELVRIEPAVIVLLHVNSFEDVPVLCKRDFERQRSGGKSEQILRRGACYVRRPGKRETSEVPTYEEMRELLDLAAERRLRSFLAQAARAGVNVSELAAQRSDDALFARERSSLQAPVLDERIRSRANWQVIVRPETFEQDRVSKVTELSNILTALKVQIRGWDFPHIDWQQSPAVEVHSIRQSYEFSHHLEWWRFFQSGQFLFVGGLSEEWRDVSSQWPAPAGWQPGGYVHIPAALYRITEIVEFASRLSTSEAGAEVMSIQISLRRVENMALDFGQTGRILTRDYKTGVDEIPVSLIVQRGPLVAESRAIARDLTAQLLQRFGYDPAPQILEEMQQQLGR